MSFINKFEVIDEDWFKNNYDESLLVGHTDNETLLVGHTDNEKIKRLLKQFT